MKRKYIAISSWPLPLRRLEYHLRRTENDEAADGDNEPDKGNNRAPRDLAGTAPAS